MRNQRHKLERIDIDELFSSPVNRGMLSFLERPPEEVQVRLREKQKVNAIDAGRLAPGGELPPGAHSQDSVTLSGESNIQRQDQAMQSNQSSLDRTSGTVSVRCELPPGGELPSGGELPPVSELTSGDNQPAAGQVLVGCPTLLDLQTTPNADPSSLLRSARHGI